MAEFYYQDAVRAARDAVEPLRDEIARLRGDVLNFRTHDVHGALQRLEHRLGGIEHEVARHDPQSEQGMHQVGAQVQALDSRLRALETSVTDMRKVIENIYRDELAEKQSRLEDQEYRAG